MRESKTISVPGIALALIRIYIENVWQCMNCFTLRLTIELPVACVCVFPVVYTYTWLCVYMCVCVCDACPHVHCHPSGRLVRPPAGIHNVKAAAVAPVAPRCPLLGAPPNLPPGRETHTQCLLVVVLVTVRLSSICSWPSGEKLVGYSTSQHFLQHLHLNNYTHAAILANFFISYKIPLDVQCLDHLRVKTNNSE